MTTTPRAASGPNLSEHPRPSLWRTLTTALTVQSVAVLALTLTVMVAAAGIRQRVVLLAGLVLIVALGWILARQLASRIERATISQAGVLPKPQASLAGASLPGVRTEQQDPTRLLAEVTANLPLPLFITDSTGRIVRHSQAALQLAGQTYTDLLGQPMDSILALWASAEKRATLAQNLVAGRMWHGELTRLTPGGTVLMDVTAIPVPGDGQNPRAVVYTMVDVTEIRHLQNLVIDMERMSTRGRMAGEIAHEINNFLTILGGNLDILPALLTSGNAEKVREKFAAMRQALEKIARFADGLMGCRDNDAEPTLCELPRLTENLVAFLKPQNRYDGVTISVECAADVPKILLKVGLIQQVLINLLNNAADAARQVRGEQARIDVFVRRLADPERVAISVADNGPGLSAEAGARVFKERYSDKPGGHGLGLLNCHRIAQAHGGTLSVESRQGVGAAFTLTLPTHPEPAGTPAPPVSRMAARA